MASSSRLSERTQRLGLAILSVVVAAASLAACDQAAEAPADGAGAAAPPPAVTVMSVEPTEITPGADFNGRVEAVDTVDLRARVTGFLEERRFAEGADVEAGELLFLLEREPLEAVVTQREAELAGAKANKVNSAAQLRRGEELLQGNNIPESEVDIRRAEDLNAAAAIQEAEAALERAEINLSYTEIHAPIDGRISEAAVSVGNLVGPESGVLATIVSQDPIYVTFPVSQRQLLQYRRRQDQAGGTAAQALVTLPDGSSYEHPGRIDFIGVQVDPGTDTVTVRAKLPNPDRILVDGQFVTVRVERGEPQMVLTVPQAALQVDQAGPFVMVVGDDDKATLRRVTLGEAEGTQAVVREGLKAGERVIVEGVQKVRPGMDVAASEAQAQRPDGEIPTSPADPPSES